MSSIWTVRRSASDVKLTGLCSGLAHHWGVDPVLVRVGCALLALSGGIGVVLYLAGWLLIPTEGHDRAPVDDFFGANGRRWSKEVWIALVVVACIMVFTLFGSISPFGVGPAVVLAVIWYFGFYKRKATGQAGPSASAPESTALATTPPPFVRYPGPPTPFTEAAEAWQRRMAENAWQSGQRTTDPAPAAWPAVPTTNLAGTYAPGPAPWAPASFAPTPFASYAPTSEPAPWSELDERRAFLATADPVGLYAEPDPATPVVVRRRDAKSARRLRLVALIVIGLALTALGILDGQGVAIPVAAYFGAALLVVGLTLVAATWLGRARGLLPVGLLLLAGLLVTSSSSLVAHLDDWNKTYVAYTEATDLPPGGDVRDAGNLHLDLSRLTVTEDLTHNARLDVGNLEVAVPSDVNVVVHYTVDVGRVQAYGVDVNAGPDLRGDVPDPTPVDGRPTLTLNLSVDAGTVRVHR